MSVRKIEPYIHNRAYDEKLVAIYGNWPIYLNIDQRYLGRCYAWWSGGHVGCMDFSEIPLADLSDFSELAGAFSGAVKSLWGATQVNYAWLGNEVEKHKGHGHFHMVPRYSKQDPSLNERIFPDPAIGKKYWVSNGLQVLTPAEVRQVQEALCSKMVFPNPEKVRTVAQFYELHPETKSETT